MQWWRGAIIYQIYPRSFQDTNGDGIGDLPGVTRRLSHLASLGVDALWISPFFKSPMVDFGYDIEDYREVDPLFGTIEDFDALLAEAHRLGLKVVIDMVLSHTSQRHRWFQESRRSRENARADWYVWADPRPDGTPPNNWLSMFGGSAWTWEPRRRQYYLHNFLPEQPDLNLHLRAVQDALLDECRFWLNRGVDGFRLDACNCLTHDLDLRDNPVRPAGMAPTEAVRPSNPYNYQMHVYNKSRPETLEFLGRLRALTDEYGDILLIAEIAADDSLSVMRDYAGPAAPLHTAYSFALLGPEFDPRTVTGAVAAFHAEGVGNRPGRDGWPSWAFSNHDVERVMSRWGGRDAPADFAKALIALLCSLRGTVFLYQGEELGLPEADVPYEQLKDPYGLNFFPDFAGRDGCRTPMPWDDSDRHAGFSTVDGWLPIPNDHLRRAVGAQAADPASVLSFTRHFLRWRAARPALVSGDIDIVAATEDVICVIRTLDRRRLLVAIELAGRGGSVDLPETVVQVEEDHHLALGWVEGDRIILPPYGAVFAWLEDQLVA
ncbi:alpha-amylase family glycosyl hydrolase [Tistrella bauzanensis]|nr:alpha-amylase family glycosyl hydrolase [Tistrella bauzanensis]